MKQNSGLNITMIIALLLGVIAVATIATAYYFINKESNNTFESNMVTLNNLQQLDAKWSEGILKTRSYTLQSFDQLAHFMKNIRENLKSLEQQGMADDKIVGQEVSRQYQIYKNSFATKNEAVERYKSEQAILRNSVRYLPEAGRAIQQSLSAIPTQKRQQMLPLLAASKLSANQYLLNVATEKEVTENLKSLEQQILTIDDDIKDKMKDYPIHLHLIISHKPKVDEMLKTAMSVDIASQSAQLVDKYAHIQDIAKQAIKFWQQVMLVGVLLLFAILLWFLFDLQKSARKISKAKTKQKNIKQQLLQSEEHVQQVDSKLRQVGQQFAAGQLSLYTLEQLNKLTPEFTTHLIFLDDIKKIPALKQHQQKMDQLILDLKDTKDQIQQLNALIDPQKNEEKQVNFDFNHVIRAAFKTVTNETGSSMFKKQLSAMPEIKASPIELYKIVIKLIKKSVEKWQEDQEKIFIKTWATGHYANLCLGISGYNSLEDIYADSTLDGLKELVEQNAAVLKLAPKKESKQAVLWVSFPYEK